MVGGMIFVGAYIARLAAKTTDVNWVKARDLGDHMGYYKARSRSSLSLKGPYFKDLGPPRY